MTLPTPDNVFTDDDLKRLKLLDLPAWKAMEIPYIYRSVVTLLNRLEAAEECAKELEILSHFHRAKGRSLEKWRTICGREVNRI